MPIWNVDDSESVTLTQWRVFEIASYDDRPITRHFVGWEQGARQGRVSSAITTFDKEVMTGTTHSGREYFLKGQTGYNQDAAYVWEAWKYRYGISSELVKDVTNEYSKPERIWK